MTPEHFTRNHEVDSAIKRIRALGPVVSDVVDANGRQYVDIVMEGGGVLGIALVGYTYALEQAGIRYLGIGGTSAGSINALLLAAMSDESDAGGLSKSEKVVQALANQDLREFVDGDEDARDLVDAMLARAGMLRLLFKGGQVIDNLRADLGLNPGTRLLDWLSGLLRREGISTSIALDARMQAEAAGLLRRQPDGSFVQEERTRQLALIAAEIRTETKVELPKMAELFWKDAALVDPALFVRASMSIPFFFHPFRVARLPVGSAARKRWSDLAGYDGEIPSDAMFMDGGIVSNFPIHVFHKHGKVPAAPTFGVKLGVDRGAPRSIGGPGNLASAIFDAARHCLDYDFITRNPDYQQLVACIETGSHNWLDFSMGPDAKVDLFRRGVLAAETFLKCFDWQQYKHTRQHLADANEVVTAIRLARRIAGDAPIETTAQQ